MCESLSLALCVCVCVCLASQLTCSAVFQLELQDSVDKREEMAALRVDQVICRKAGVSVANVGKIDL